ncbi:MAG: DUF354 domain-containing protein, partial [Thermoplasmatales archaeon]|nr:DUF354 domain-containing protein [Thermoplasmatales archaeon]
GNLSTIWFDFSNTPHVNFLYPIVKMLNENYKIFMSARRFSETTYLIRKRFKLEPLILGKHYGKNKLFKIYGLLYRLIQLSANIPYFDISISCGGFEASLMSTLRRKKSIVFDDNDISPNWLYAPFADFAFFPAVVPYPKLKKQGFRNNRLYQYHGYKEDIYVADYKPSTNFLDNLPFAEFVTIRPENIMANYLNKKAISIVPDLIKIIQKKGINVLFLPRYNSDRQYVKNFENVFIPDKPVNGLDVCYYSKAVLTGAGTFAREAACLGTPAISFYSGKKLLSVDKQMIQDGWLFFSRNPQEIAEYLSSACRRKPNLSRSKNVQKEVFSKLGDIILEFKK